MAENEGPAEETLDPEELERERAELLPDREALSTLSPPGEPKVPLPGPPPSE
jgi:hypothetical protein